MREKDLLEERHHVESFKAMLEEFSEHAAYLWRWGDGDGGYVIEEMRAAMRRHQPWVIPPRDTPSTRQRLRAPIPRRTRTAVYERDDYACVVCGTRENLTLDHIHPHSLGGSDEIDNLQTMCGPHNSSKGARI